MSVAEQLRSLWAAVCLFVLFFSARSSSCLSAHFHARCPASLPWCMYICLPAFLSVPQVLWDCHKVLITHMTSPTSCLPCILGLSGLKNPFTRLPLFFPPLAPVLLCLLLFPPVSLGWAHGALPLRSRMVCESKLLTFGLCRNHRASGCKVFQIVLSYNSCSLPPYPTSTPLFSKQSSLSPTLSSRLTLCSMRQKPHLAVI